MVEGSPPCAFVPDGKITSVGMLCVPCLVGCMFTAEDRSATILWRDSGDHRNIETSNPMSSSVISTRLKFVCASICRNCEAV